MIERARWREAGTGVVAAMALLAAPGAAQEAPTLTAADYGQWESLGSFSLSPDGTWLAYEVRRVNEENELRIREEGADSARVVAYGSGATFSDDGRWLAYRIGVSPDVDEGDEEAEDRVGLLDLEAGADTVFDAARFAFSDDGRFLALVGYGAGDLLVRDLAAGTMLALGNVASFEWSPRGHLLALTLETESGAGNGVQLLDAGAGTLRSLVSADADFKALTWRDDEDDLAVLRSREDDAFTEETHEIFLWRDLSRGIGDSYHFDPYTAPGFPEAMRVTELRTLEWSDDGASLFFGIRPREANEKAGAGDGEEAGEGEAQEDEEEPGDEVEPSDVEIWHARDMRIIPMQQAQASRDKRRTLLSVWHVDEGAFVQLGTDLMNDQEVVGGGRWATESTDAPYAWEVMFGRPWSDVHLVDVADGTRERVIEKVRYFWGDSPDGRYLVYFHGDDWRTYDLERGRHANITESLDADFADRSYDYPVAQLPARGFVPGGWLQDDAGVLVYDEFDIWVVNPDGSGGTRITDGSIEEIVHRAVRLDPDADAFDPDEPLFVSLAGDRTKGSGYGRVSLRRQGGVYAPRGGVERLIYVDARVARLSKAAQSDRFAFTRERFDDSPDVFVGGADLDRARQWTTTNPFQDDYAWGRAELVDFVNERGVPLQAVLQYPAGYVEGRTYPMIVYTYEMLSQNLHRYITPSERSYYNFQVWTQQGYFVLQPDIVYRPRDPGVSAVEAVVPAVAAAVATGMVDADRVGLIGHSWGGYQATYIPTRTDIFAAAVAGAPLTNFLSMPGSIHWNPGFPELGHWETGQGRMDVPPWEDFEAHVRNSPAAFIQDLETPMLMMQGSDDGVVDFRQGVEFYNYARRAGKEFVFLVYPGADHGLRDESNQVDYHRRILEWFGHYLKGQEAPAWMTEGVPWLQREKEIGG